MTAATVRSTKAFLMKNPLTSSFEMFSTLFMASSDRDWILARIWLRPLRVLCGFSPLLWVMAVVCRTVIKGEGTQTPLSCDGNTIKVLLIHLLPVAPLDLSHTFCFGYLVLGGKNILRVKNLQFVHNKKQSFWKVDSVFTIAEQWQTHRGTDCWLILL